MASHYMSDEEVRTTALIEAVKVTATHPHFHGDLTNPSVIQFASNETIDLAKSFERYIRHGQ